MPQRVGYDLSRLVRSQLGMPVQPPAPAAPLVAPTVKPPMAQRPMLQGLNRALSVGPQRSQQATGVLSERLAQLRNQIQTRGAVARQRVGNRVRQVRNG